MKCVEDIISRWIDRMGAVFFPDKIKQFPIIWLIIFWCQTLAQSFRIGGIILSFVSAAGAKLADINSLFSINTRLSQLPEEYHMDFLYKIGNILQI